MVAEILWVSRRGRRGRFSEMIGRTTAGEMIHPRGEATVIAIGVPIFQHALKYCLRDVFGGRAIAGEFYEKPKQPPMVAFKELAQRVQFSVAHSQHQVVIGKGCCSSGFHGSGVFNHERRRLNMYFWKVGDHVGRGTCKVAEETVAARIGYRKSTHRALNASWRTR